MGLVAEPLKQRVVDIHGSAHTLMLTHQCQDDNASQRARLANASSSFSLNRVLTMYGGAPAVQ